jgi:hypothetical protein
MEHNEHDNEHETDHETHCEICAIKKKYNMDQAEASFVVALIVEEQRRRTMFMKMAMMGLDGVKITNAARERGDELLTPEFIRQTVDEIDKTVGNNTADTEMRDRASMGFAALMEKIQAAGGLPSREELMEMAKEAGFSVMQFGDEQPEVMGTKPDTKPTVH